MNEHNTSQAVRFSDLGISPSILTVLEKLNLEIPTPIQQKAIPSALEGNDIIGIAQTGTGKTFAFGIPMLERIGKTKGNGLILLPTRELALQVDENMQKIGRQLGLRTASLIGGEPIAKQIKQIQANPHVIVATPGRLIDHLNNRKTLSLRNVNTLVLDEADMMFDMGFIPQVEEILSQVPKDRQTMLFSATMPATIVRLINKHMKLPLTIEVAPAGTTAERVDQEIYVVNKEDRFNQLTKMLDEYTGSVLIFTRTKHGAKALTRNIDKLGFGVAEIHSNRSFEQRKAALGGFKSGKYRILVATDIAARGIDVNDIELVVNFDLPDSTEDYVHRIGRTARAGKKGKAISFALPTQWKDVRDIEKLIKKDLPMKEFAQMIKPAPQPKASLYGRMGGSRPTTFRRGARRR